MSSLTCPQCGEPIYFVEEATNYWMFSIEDLVNGELILEDLADSRTGDDDPKFTCSKGHPISVQEVIKLGKNE